MRRVAGRSLAPPSALSAKSSSSGAGIAALCDAAAAAQTCTDMDHRAGLNKQIVEVEAFSSVHDMIHAAILHYGPRATLRQIYQACEERGRIAYKRSGGSRLITHNAHWKSQIRHALYTSERFQRHAPGEDLWLISKSHANLVPQTTTVAIFADEDAAVDEDAPDSSICEASNVGGVAAEGTGAGTQATSPVVQANLRYRGRGDQAIQPPFVASPSARAPAASPIIAMKGARSNRNRRGRASVTVPRPQSQEKLMPETASRAGSKEGVTAVCTGESEGIAGYSMGPKLALPVASMPLWQPNPVLKPEGLRSNASASDLSLLQAGIASPLAGIDLRSVFTPEAINSLSKLEYGLLLSCLPEPDRRSKEAVKALLERPCFHQACEMAQKHLVAGTLDMRQLGVYTRLPFRAEAAADTSYGRHGLLQTLKEEHSRGDPCTAPVKVPITYMPSASGRSAEADSSSPGGSKHAMDRSPSEGVVPIKKRLKEAAKADKEAHSPVVYSRRILGLRDGDGTVSGSGLGLPGSDSSSRYHKQRRIATPVPLESKTPVSTPKAREEPNETDGMDDAGRSLRNGRGRPPTKPSTQPGSLPETPVVVTPAIAPPPAVKNVTPTTEMQLPPPRSTRLTRRTSLGTPVSAPEAQQGRGLASEGHSNADIFRACALLCLKDEGKAMSAQDLVARALDRNLPCKPGKTPEHTMASALYMDMESNEKSPFRPYQNGKFGLIEWGEES